MCVFVWFYDYILHERYTNMRSRAHFLSLRLFDRQTFVLTSCPSLSLCVNENIKHLPYYQNVSWERQRHYL